MKVLVTGASGQVGGALMESVPSDMDAIGLTRADLDLCDQQAIREMIFRHQPDWVINAAAYTAVDQAESEPELAAAVNANAVEVIAAVLRETGGRLFQLSTDCVFDGTAREPYRPSDERAPLSVYGQTKACGEDAAGDNAIILRLSWVHGAGHNNFVTTMLRLMKERDRIAVVDDQIGAPGWAPDIARTIWAMIESGRSGIFHHRDAGETSRHGWAHAIAEESVALGLIERVPEIAAIPTSEFPTPARRPLNSVLDDSSTRALLGDQTRSWRVNLRSMLEEQRTHA